VNTSATAGKVILASTTIGLACNGGSTLCSSAQLALIVDLVGYGATANFFEGAGPTPAPSATTAVFRAANGCTETDNNSADFAAGAPSPRNTATPLSPCGDAAPTVTSTTPSNGATNVPLAANIALDFSEPVDVAGAWFTIVCTSSGTHTATVSGGPSSFTVDPDADFAADETCTVTVLAAQVTDQDTDDPPDNMAANASVSFSTAAVCGAATTPIHDVQGSGLSSPIVGSIVSVEGVVVGDYQAAGQFGGFHVQEEDADADADPATSEGIFVFSTAVAVSVGDQVRVRGTVTEFPSSGITLTELASVSTVLVCATGVSATPTSVSLPVTSVGDLERYEAMSVSLGQTLTVTENFTLARFGEVSLSVGGRLANPTAVVAPGPPAIALQNLNNRSRIVLDDGNNQQNIDPTLYPAGGLSASNTLRNGDTVPGLTGVLEQRFGVYRLQPVGAIAFSPDNPRPLAPDAVGGTLRVSAFNVLNYFNGDGLGGGFPTARGATSAAEFTRQRDKIISALTALDGDIVGLMELENDTAGDSAIEDLVDGLNAVAGPGTYDFIDTGIVGTDAIRVGLLYQPAVVSPVGPFAILDSSVDPTFLDTKNRPSLAQTFIENATGAKVTVDVNHLKSKGSDCNDVGDPDTGDGQGNCNLTRTSAAIALATWLASDPTDSGDPDFLIIGDLNSYALEDPISALVGAGFTNLVDSQVGSSAYSFVFQGQSGYLDHALSNPMLTPQVTGLTEWHVNADEPIALDYNLEFKTVNHQTTLYAPGPYRSSDHDPLLVGLDLDAPPTIAVTAGGTCASGTAGGTVLLAVADDNTPAGSLVLSFVSTSNSGLVPASGIVLGGSGAARTLAITPVAKKGGTAIITLSLSDGVYATSFTLTVIVGSDKNDTLTGTSGADLILGLGGNDSLSGLAGNDLLCGGKGVDTMAGGDGDDTLDGQNGDDVLRGGNDNDILGGGNGNDRLEGEAGDDTLTGGSGADVFSGGPGTDTLVDVTPSQGDTTDGT